MTINLGAIPTQVIVNGLDVSQAFISLSISGNALDDSGWFRPRGQIVLGQLPGFSESFDCRANPGRWAPGNIVAVSVWLGGVYVPLPWRLRILAYPNRPMPGSRTITLEVGTDADLLNYRAPEGDPGNDEYGTPAGATTLINRALAQAGAPALTDTISTFFLPFSPEKNTGGSWIAYAGSVAYAARQILWQQTNGDIRATPLTLDGLTPAATYTVGTDEADYVLSAPGEQPPESVEVQGTTYLIEDATPEGTDVTEEINGVLTRTRVEFEDWETDDQKIIETVWIPLELIAPPKFAGNSGPSILKITTTTRSYDEWGRLTQTVVEVQQPLFIVRDNISNNQVYWPFTRVTITNEYPLSFPEPEIAGLIKTRELITKRTTREQVLPPDSLNLVDRLVTVESWEKKKAEQYLYQRNVTDSSEDSLRVQSQPSPPQFEAPPATEFKPATKQRTEVSRRGQARFTNAVGSSFAEKKWIIQLPSGMALNDTQCRAHAALWGRVRQGRQFQVSWAADLIASWLTSFSPVRRIDFTLNGVTTAYLIEAFNIALDTRSAAVGGIGLELGIVSGGNVAPPYVAIPQFNGAGIIQLSGASSVEVAITLNGVGVIQISATGSVDVAPAFDGVGTIQISATGSIEVSL